MIQNLANTENSIPYLGKDALSLSMDGHRIALKLFYLNQVKNVLHIGICCRLNLN